MKLKSIDLFSVNESTLCITLGCISIFVRNCDLKYKLYSVSIVSFKSTCNFDLAPMKKIIIFNKPSPSNKLPLD